MNTIKQPKSQNSINLIQIIRHEQHQSFLVHTKIETIQTRSSIEKHTCPIIRQTSRPPHNSPIKHESFEQDDLSVGEEKTSTMTTNNACGALCRIT